MDLIIKLIKNQHITNKYIDEALYEICENEHSNCNEKCPVYAHMTQLEKKFNNCIYFKSGATMRKFLIKRLK